LPPTHPLSTPSPNLNITNPGTYSNVLKSNPQNPIKVHESLRRAEVRTRQILLTPKEDHPLHSKHDTNESIAYKLQHAIDATRSSNDSQIEIKSVILFNNKGILFKVQTVQVATWLRNTQTREKLLTHLNLPAEMKDHYYSIIVPYIPISFNVANDDSLNAIERDSGLPSNSIVSARWIKPLK
jgi:hypothetical protein